MSIFLSQHDFVSITNHQQHAIVFLYRFVKKSQTFHRLLFIHTACRLIVLLPLCCPVQKLPLYQCCDMMNFLSTLFSKAHLDSLWTHTSSCACVHMCVKSLMNLINLSQLRPADVQQYSQAPVWCSHWRRSCDYLNGSGTYTTTNTWNATDRWLFTQEPS